MQSSRQGPDRPLKIARLAVRCRGRTTGRPLWAARVAALEPAHRPHVLSARHCRGMGPRHDQNGGLGDLGRAAPPRDRGSWRLRDGAFPARRRRAASTRRRRADRAAEDSLDTSSPIRRRLGAPGSPRCFRASDERAAVTGRPRYPKGQKIGGVHWGGSGSTLETAVEHGIGSFWLILAHSGSFRPIEETHGRCCTTAITYACEEDAADGSTYNSRSMPWPRSRIDDSCSFAGSEMSVRTISVPVPGP